MGNDYKRRDYLDHVETLADAVATDWYAWGNVEYDDYHSYMTESIFENVDGSAWIINHARALRVLEYANNEPQDWKHMIDDESDYRKVIQVMAFTALEMDVYDELRDRGDY